MIARGKIHDHLFGHHDFKIAVVYGVVPLIHEHPCIRGTRINEIGHSLIHSEISDSVADRRGKRVEPAVHGHATDLIALISGAMPHLGSFHERGKHALFQVDNVSVIWRARWSQPAFHPGMELISHVAVIWNKDVVVIIGIHDPTEAELPEIAQTLNALGSDLGFAQSWQQHRRKDRDDCDDNEQLD